MTVAVAAQRPFSWVDKEGRLHFSFHPGQARAWRSERRVVLMLAGSQGGKTVFGPPWLWREIQRRGAGDYLVVAPSYKLMNLKALPSFTRLFETQLRLGRYHKGDKVFVVSRSGEQRLFGGRQDVETQIFFGHADEPESLEAATAKAAWLDEPGQRRFKLESWEAVRRRLGRYEGRLLLTTTPYNLGWLKLKVFDPFKRGQEAIAAASTSVEAEAIQHKQEIDVIHFDSLQNPVFPRAEWERARRDLPAWKFNLFYRAVFTRPAGLIYDAFDADRHVVDPFPISGKWPRYLGVDFGGVNTAAIWYAQEPATGRLFAYREYLEGKRTAQQHADAILKDQPRPLLAAGGSKSEGQWRDEFLAAGLALQEPEITSVELGIDRVYGFHQRGEVMVFRDLERYLSEKESYSRVLDENGEATEAIEDKHSFHMMDAERYILGQLGAPSVEAIEIIYDPDEFGGFVE